MRKLVLKSNEAEYSASQLPQSRAGRQGPYLRSLHHLGRGNEVKEKKIMKKFKGDGKTD